MKSVIYVRVSYSEQVGNTSLASQEDACRKWCDDAELPVDRVFREEGESAKSDKRTEFQKMFRYLETVQGLISHVVVWKQDRFSRSVADVTSYKEKLRKLNIRLVSVTEHMDDSPLGELMSVIVSGFDQLDNRNRAMRSNVAMRSTFNSGRWVWGTPIGYLRQSSPLQCFGTDPVKGPLVVKLFEAVASGHVTKATALAHVTRLGLRSNRGKLLTGQRVKEMLENEIYCGWMNSKTWGMRVKGDFAPLISEQLFYRVQAVLSGRAVVVTPHRKLREDFPLKGTLRCNVCNRTVTAGLSKGGMGTRYGYYRCYRASGHFSVRADVIEGALDALLELMKPEPIRLNAVVSLFRSIWRERMKTSEEEARQMKQTLLNLEEKESRLMTALMDGAMTSDQFKKASAPVTKQIEDLRQEVASYEYERLDLDDAVDYLQSMCLNLHNLWQSNDLAQRSSLLKLIWPLGITWDGKQFEPKVTNSLFLKLGDTAMSDSGLASPTRFELVLSP